MKSTAIILAGGRGSRMGGETPKQYLPINNVPLICYTIKAFEESIVNEIVIVADDIQYMSDNIIRKYGFSKVLTIVKGGKERYDSVYNGLKAIENSDIVLVHDGARPLVNAEIIEKSVEEALRYGACVAGVRVKDTIKICDDNNFTVDTPDRKTLWAMQTPQTFKYSIIREAYEMQHKMQDDTVTDDACVVERFMKCPVHIFEGDYRNIKVTTPEDMELASLWLGNIIITEC